MSYNFVFQVGCDFSRVISYTDSTGTPINLTGFTAHMEVRPSYANSSKILDLTPTINGTAGTVTITVPHTVTPDLSQTEVTKTLSEGSLVGTGPVGVYDLLLTAPGGVVSKLLDGQVVFVPVVTR